MSYPYCEAVQEVLVDRGIGDPEEYKELGLVLAAYDNKPGCLNEEVWDIDNLLDNIVRKFRYAIIGVMNVKGLGVFDKDYDIIVEPSYEDVTMYTVQDNHGRVLVHSHCKAWHFGTDDDIEELESFFEYLALEIKTPPKEWIHQLLKHNRAILEEADDMAMDLDLTITFHTDLGFVISHGDGPRHEVGYDPKHLFTFMDGYREGNYQDE